MEALMKFDPFSGLWIINLLKSEALLSDSLVKAKLVASIFSEDPKIFRDIDESKQKP